MYRRLADSSQTMKSFLSVGELPSKLISDNFYANFETLRLFSISYDDCDIDELAFFFFLSSVLIFQDKRCIVFKKSPLTRDYQS